MLWMPLFPDPETSSVLAYERYIERVRSDSWGDHVVNTALANGTEISVRVYSYDQQSNAQPTSQSNFDASDQPPMSSSNININDQTTTPLDDNAIEESNEHIRQITGGPLAIMMSIENPDHQPKGKGRCLS